ncbi:unnamed protein product [Knipowitschia caucasica]|uniref:Uncharacterized protein n=1 Tax=Knipowitschia caucasica TaxID=637954 RepID=A0AAV2J1U9_KNICA
MVKKVCPCNQLCRTNSTSAVGGSGVSSQGGSQNLGPPHQRKGTFTDDLHKLVDNWARDAISLSQGKKSAKQLQQTFPQGHSYELIQSANMGRKFSAPGQLCPSSGSAGSAQLPANPGSHSSLSARKSSLGQTPTSPTPPSSQSQPPQFIHYHPSAAYSAQWSGPAHVKPLPHQAPPLLVSASQPLAPYNTSTSQNQSAGQASLQAFHLSNALHKSVSNPGGPNLRTT